MTIVKANHARIESTLRLVNEDKGGITCCGYAESARRRCRNTPAAARIMAARDQLQLIPDSLGDTQRLQAILKSVTGHLLCHLHRHEASGLVRKWTNLLESLARESNTSSGHAQEARLTVNGKAEHMTRGVSQLAIEEDISDLILELRQLREFRETFMRKHDLPALLRDSQDLDSKDEPRKLRPSSQSPASLPSLLKFSAEPVASSSKPGSCGSNHETIVFKTEVSENIKTELGVSPSFSFDFVCPVKTEKTAVPEGSSLCKVERQEVAEREIPCDENSWETDSEGYGRDDEGNDNDNEENQGPEFDEPDGREICHDDDEAGNDDNDDDHEHDGKPGVQDEDDEDDENVEDGENDKDARDEEQSTYVPQGRSGLATLASLETPTASPVPTKHHDWESAWTCYRESWTKLAQRDVASLSTPLRDILPWPVRDGIFENVTPAAVEEFFTIAPGAVVEDDAAFGRLMRREKTKWLKARLEDRFGYARATRETDVMIKAKCVYDVLDGLV